MTRAGFGPRAAAYLIDRAILLAGLCLVRLPFGLASLYGGGGLTAKSFLFDHSFVDVLCWLLASAYFVLLTYFTGSTLGKKVMRLRVEKEDGSALGPVDAIYRETVGRFLSGILCLGYLMALADRKKRAFHDYLCDTRVVYDEVAFRTRDGKARENTPAPGWTPASETPAEEETASPAAQYSVPGQTAAPADMPAAARPLQPERETEAE